MNRNRFPAFPIAIVGLSCRFPGAASIDELWALLKGRVDAVGEAPRDRWDTDYFYHPAAGQPCKAYTKAGGFLADIDKFDAEFFGISPREACQMDPQQRLMLELVWEALDSTGLPPSVWAGPDTGVFLGVASDDYWAMQREQGEGSDPYMMSGSAMSILANRVSYIFDLHGPSMSIDTACSSSLVALHEACACLWAGEAAAAIAGGVNAVLSPWGHIGFSQATMLSPTGRCRAFDAKGDGYVRSEGGGVVLLRPLADALADGSAIHAVIMGTGVNSDGRTSGISLPNPVAQEQLLRRVYGSACIDPGSLSYIEAHGTGTAAGDPLECQALGRVFGAARPPGDPMPIGSIKTNIGHSEAASGIAGLIKVVLSLKHRELAPTLHFETPNPNIPFADINLTVATEPLPLDGGAAPLLMGVNSFGFGGTNAHAVLREHVMPPDVEAPSTRQLEPLLISARSAAALKALADRYRQRLKVADGPSLAALCRGAATQRNHHPHRLAIVGRTADEIAARLDRFVAGETDPLVEAGPSRTKPARIAFVFSGNGSQWLGMGRDLLATEPVFAEWLSRVDQALAPLVGWHVVDILRSDAVPNAFDRTEIAQPALFALQIGVLEWLRAHGVVGDASVGHSVGEVAAAYAAGILSLGQACCVIAHRSLAQAVTAGAGKMAAVGLAVEQAAELIAPYGAQLNIASVNSPTSVTLAGDEAALAAIGADLDAKGVFFRLLALDYAFHSSAMDPIQDDLLARLAELVPGPARSRFVSTVTGDDIDGAALDASYWWNNVRQPVQFAAAIDRLSDGIDLFLEIGPHPVLSVYLRECLRSRERAPVAIATLRRSEPEQAAVWRALAQCYANGATLDFRVLFPEGGRPVDLPSYPWQRERYWFAKRAEPVLPLYGPREHPLLGYRLPTNDAHWENDLQLWHNTYLRDHVVQGSTVFPGTAYVEMAFAAAALRISGTDVEIEDLEIRRPLILSAERGAATVFSLTSDDSSFQIGLRDAAGTRTLPLATGRLVPFAAASPPPVAVDALCRRLSHRIDGADHYRRCLDRGLAYGAAFRGVAELWSGDDEAIGRIAAPAALAGSEGNYRCHPALLDACLQVTFGAVADDDADRASFVPTAFERIRLYGAADALGWCHVRLTRRSRRLLVARLVLLGADGSMLGEIDGLQLRRIESSSGAAVSLYHWQSMLQESPARLPVSANLPAAPALAVGVARPGADGGTEIGMALDRLAAAYAWQLMASMTEDGTLNIPALAACGAVAADRAIYFRSLLDLLARHGLATRRAMDWMLEQRHPPAEADDLWQQLVARHPEALASLQLIGRCGERLADFVRGDSDGADIVFVARDFNSMTQFFESDPFSRGANDIVQRIVRRLVQETPADRRLHVLEVGGAAGSGLTSSLLPILPRDRTDYVYGAPSADAAASAEAAFADAPFLHGAVLELQRDPSAQGFGMAQFDMILVASALHETGDLRSALTHLRQLLKPGGLLVVTEPRASDFLAFVFGMTPGWWAFTDIDLRVDSPLLAPSAWRELLAGSGFDETAVVDEPGLPVAVLLATNGSEAVRRAPPAAEREPATWLLFLADKADDDGTGEQAAHEIARRLTESGQSVIIVQDGDPFSQLGRDRFAVPIGDVGAYRRLLESLARQDCVTPVNLLYLRGLASLPEDTEPVALQDRGSLDLVSLVQAADAAGPALSLRLWVVTAQAVPVPSGVGLRNPAHAPLWGVGRTLMNERPGLACRLIDIDFDLDVRAAEYLVDELLWPSDENEIMLRHAARYVHRLHRGLPAEAVEKSVTADTPPFKLALRSRDAQDGLGLQAIALPLPGSGEVLVRVRAAGLNFRDVLQRTGILPEEAFEGGFAGATLGMEFAGEIVAVGPEVTGLAKGQEVFGFAPAAMSSHLIAKAFAVFPKPKEWSFAAAATMPVAHLTVFYSLDYLARLRRGERILIHGGAGGVGLAAIQYAKWVGAEIFASAGTAEKRDFLRRLGVDHVVDSRSLGFADEIRRITGGQGVDVVLNSLAGEAIQKGVALLRPYGRFIELGKRDFYANSKLGLAPFRNNIQFFGVDVDRLLLDRPELTAELFQDIAKLMDVRVLHPLVHRVFPVTRAADAFRHMQQSHHIGKVVLSFDGDAVAAARIDKPVPAGPLSLSPDATYLVTGGRGGFGLATAEWLASKGARHLVLVGRGTAPKAEAASALDRLKAAGVSVHEIAVDVTDAAALDGLLRTIGADMPPLRGIVHAAAVIDDSALVNMTPERFRAALGAKMLGAWNLHRLTRGMALDFFILYSSAVTLIGNPGQANYMAANLYLEALAHQRRAAGLPALVMCWGAIAEVGHVGRNTDLAKFMTDRLGVIPIAPRRAFEALEHALLAGAVQVAAAELSWSRLAALPQLARSPKYAAMRDQFAATAEADGGHEPSRLAETLATLSPEEAQAMAEQIVVKQVASVMRMSAAKLDVNQSLIDLGMDSLMVVELQLALEQQLGVSIPTLELMDMATVANLARRVIHEIAKAAPGTPERGRAPVNGEAPAHGASPANGAGPAEGDAGVNGFGVIETLEVEVDALPEEALDDMLDILLGQEVEQRLDQITREPVE